MLRTRRVRCLTLPAVFVLGVCMLAQETDTPDVTGEWSITLDQGPQDIVSLEVVFNQDADKAITGTATSELGAFELTGTIEGPQILFYFLIGTPGEAGASQWSFSGTVDQNSTIAGTMEGNMGEFSVAFTAERKP